MSTPTRTVHCGCAIAWLRDCQLPADHAFLTSLPDRSELRRMTFVEWQQWFVATATLVVTKTPPRAAAVFYQTDVHHDGGQVDKAYLVHRGAEAAGARLLWHKIVCRAPAGTVTRGRPGYAHLLCFSRELRSDPADAVADVLPRLGTMTWPRAMGTAAVAVAVGWLRDVAHARVIVDPFCGMGTALAVANRMGLSAFGVERSTTRAQRARDLDLPVDAG